MKCTCGCNSKGNCMGAPMQLNYGQSPNPNVQYGQADMDTGYPVTYRRHLAFYGAQLNTGTERLAMYKIDVRGARFNWGSVPRLPGQNRTSGQNQADFVPTGNSPSQWDNHLAMGPGLQPQNPGGPGQIAMNNFRNPGSGA